MQNFEGRNERHFRLERIYPTQKEASAIGTNKFAHQFGTETSYDNNNTTNNQKSQIAPLPSQYNMQQKKNNIPTKQDFESKVSMPMVKTGDVLKIASKNIAKQINDTGGFDLKQRSWVETATESDVLKDKVYIDDLEPGKISYVVHSNKKSFKKES